MLCRQDVAFRMRHQPQHTSRGIAQPRDVSLGPIWVDRVGTGLAFTIHKAKHDLAGLLETLKDPRLSADEPTFAMSDRNMQPIEARKKRTLAGRRLQVNPAVLE